MELRFYEAMPVKTGEALKKRELNVAVKSLSGASIYDKYSPILSEEERPHFARWCMEAKTGEVSWLPWNEDLMVAIIAIRTDVSPAFILADWCKDMTMEPC